MMGAVLFGVGPAFQTISDLIEEEGLSYEDQTFRRPFAAGSKTFGEPTPVFIYFSVLLAIAAYNLYLSSQIQGLLWLMIDFLLVVVEVVSLVLLYLYSLLFESIYETSLLNTIKLAFVSLFLNSCTFAKSHFLVS